MITQCSFDCIFNDDKLYGDCRIPWSNECALNKRKDKKNMINPLPLLVAAAFKNAEENGYFFEDYTDNDIANDMIMYDADIAEYPFEQVLKYVRIQRIANR